MAIKIGFDDDPNLLQELDEDGEIVHGDGYKGEQKYIPVKIPERRKAKILEEFEVVVVRDFGDDYHLSEEERAAKNKFYEAFKIIRKSKRVYRKLDQYVSVMRDYLKALDIVAERNGVYEPEEFKKLFMKGKIYVNGLDFPKLKGREAKHISIPYLTEFILSDADPKEIYGNQEEEFYTEEELEEMATKLFDEGEIEEILKESKKMEDQYYRSFDENDEEQDSRNVALSLDRKAIKKINKNIPEIMYAIKEMKREEHTVSNMSRYVSDIDTDDFEQIARYDERFGYKSKSDVPKFKGDIMNDRDYDRYMQKLEEFEETEVKYLFEGKLMNGERIRNIQTRTFLERHGWNVRNLYDNKDKEKKLKKIQKEENKREKELKKKLANIEERRNRRLGQETDKTKKKKKGKGSGKTKTKSPKKNKEIDRTDSRKKKLKR